MSEATGNGGQGSQEPPVKLNDIPAKVVRVNVDGVGRTKETLIMKNLAAMFKVNHFEDLVIQAQDVRTKLQGKYFTLRFGKFWSFNETCPLRELSTVCIRANFHKIYTWENSNTKKN